MLLTEIPEVEEIIARTLTPEMVRIDHEARVITEQTHLEMLLWPEKEQVLRCIAAVREYLSRQ